MPTSPAEVEKFMQRERLAAFCTVDSENKPHVVPVFFTYVNEKAYVQTDRNSVKVHNLLKNPHVAVLVCSGEFGEEVVIIRGQARIVDEDEFVVRTQEHIDKYHIQLDVEGKDGMDLALFDQRVRCVVEITAECLLYW